MISGDSSWSTVIWSGTVYSGLEMTVCLLCLAGFNLMYCDLLLNDLLSSGNACLSLVIATFGVESCFGCGHDWTCSGCNTVHPGNCHLYVLDIPWSVFLCSGLEIILGYPGNARLYVLDIPWSVSLFFAGNASLATMGTSLAGMVGSDL